MPTLIVAATSPTAGKTAITAAVADHLTVNAPDGKVTVATAWEGGEGAADLRESIGGYAASEPLGAIADTPATIASKVKEIAGNISIIEGKTTDHAANLALAEELDGLVLLVAQSTDDILSSASSYGSRLAGVVINYVSRYRVHEVESRIIPALRQANINVIGWIPEDRRLLAPTLRLVAEHLESDFISNEEGADRLIDNFLIGGMILDWGPFYFGSRDNVGVVVRGDRPDIQLAALQTGTVRAMVLTKGARPVEYVLYEAMQRGIPLVVTDGSTEEVATKLEGLQAKVRFNHPDKVARIRELALERLDLDALEKALSQPVTR